MKTKITGSCLCGKISYEYTGEIGPSGYCHCSDCRKVTGSAFLVSSYKSAKYSKFADGGGEIIREFCPNCGSPLFTFSPDYPDYVWVKSGSLDDPGVVKPAHQGWTDSKVEWADIPHNITSYPKDSDLPK